MKITIALLSTLLISSTVLASGQSSKTLRFSDCESMGQSIPFYQELQIEESGSIKLTLSLRQIFTKISSELRTITWGSGIVDIPGHLQSEQGNKSLVLSGNANTRFVSKFIEFSLEDVSINGSTVEEVAPEWRGQLKIRSLNEDQITFLGSGIAVVGHWVMTPEKKTTVLYFNPNSRDAEVTCKRM